MSQMKKGIIAIAMILGAISTSAQQALVSTNTPPKLVFRLTKLESGNWMAQQYNNGSVIFTDTTTLDEFTTKYNGYKVLTGNLELSAREYAEANSISGGQTEKKWKKYKWLFYPSSPGNTRYYRTFVNGNVYTTAITTMGNTVTVRTYYFH